ncbi:hypothetical protein ACHAWF_006299 [Thalassiosira exigua]
MCRSYTPSGTKSTMAALPVSTVADGVCQRRVVDGPNNLSKHLALLLGVVRSQRWHAFEKIALSNEKTFRTISAAISDVDGFERVSSLLHHCLRYDPPLRIVAKMLQMLPDRTAALRAQDHMGRTPLHVAAACHADPMVLKLLGNADPTTCRVQDEDGRTPLHLACDGSSGTGNEDEGSLRRAPCYDSVRALLSESLDAAVVEDEDGMNALEHAIMSDASMEVVNLLQKASMTCLRDRESGQSSRKRAFEDVRSQNGADSTPASKHRRVSCDLIET